MRHHRFTRSAALGLALTALAAPSALAMPADPAHPRSLDQMGGLAQDMRNPDNRDGAAGGGSGQDLRSPDAREAATVARSADNGTSPTGQQLAAQDMRSPDARDAADGRGTFSAPEMMVVKVREPAPAPVATTTSSGIDWGDASLGAGGLLGLTLLAAGGSFVLVRRRHATPTA